MSATIVPLRSVLAHLWLNPCAGGWVAVTSAQVDPDFPTPGAEYVPVTKAARIYARRLADRHGVRLLIHAGEDF